MELGMEAVQQNRFKTVRNVVEDTEHENGCDDQLHNSRLCEAPAELVWKAHLEFD
jgi:hypothetical protein